MKNSLETLAIIIVAILSVVIIGFIIWFNFIDTKIDYRIPELQPVIKKEKVKEEKAYLDKMESYDEEDLESEEGDDELDNLEDLEDDTNSVETKKRENTQEGIGAELEEIADS